MRKSLTWAAPLALLLAPAGAGAQDRWNAQIPVERADEYPGGKGESGGDWLGGLMQAFTPEPLTPEQEARLPLAAAVVAQLFPEGSMGQMMSSLADTILTPLQDMAPSGAAQYVARRLGMESWDLDLDEAQAERAASLLDPAWRIRSEREMQILPQMMQRVVERMEAPVRRAMTEMYAIRFSVTELTDIAAFFATPSGAAFARQSQEMSSDPRMASASMAAIPAMMGSLTAMEAEIAAATADLPAERRYFDLPEADRKRLAQMVGLSREELDEQMLFIDSAHGAQADEGW
ncbi:DUF2059 domain-containing protein [Alteraurantiacibacter palmitatis]|uniref:DUF2059 domain-containing protein n=1 Tax=Alteraurantiacibacter palmitatis TaxID=2054628 RepID=A0ABV7E4D7_9SPHN